MIGVIPLGNVYNQMEFGMLKNFKVDAYKLDFSLE